MSLPTLPIAFPPTAGALRAAVKEGALDALLTRLYLCERFSQSKARLLSLLDTFLETFGDRPGARIFSVPGRTELSGNHTDHNGGRVLAAAVNVDILAVAAPQLNRGEPVIRIHSKGYAPDEVSLRQPDPRPEERNTSAALIRGTAARFSQLGYETGGFDAVTVSDVLKGSGLSSSAAFEVLAGACLNTLYNGGALPAAQLAGIAQYAENVYFGKPSGLMDQMACAVGGVSAMDFQDGEHPVIEPVEVDFSAWGYRLCLVDTGDCHADLTPDYAAVPAEMRAVAQALHGRVLRDIDPRDFYEALPRLREQVSDRALLRSLHFFEENQRVEQQAAALRRGDFPAYLELVNASGRSSFEYLQNLYSPRHPDRQGAPLALALAGRLLQGRGACRVHGGGFGGTTQNFVPADLLPEFVRQMERVFGPGSCHVLNIRQEGALCLDV